MIDHPVGFITESSMHLIFFFLPLLFFLIFFRFASTDSGNLFL